MNLYELSKELATINDELVSGEGEITDELEKRLDSVKMAFAEKVTNIRKWIATIDGDDNALEQEIRRLEHIKRVRKNLRTRLLDYVKQNMELADLKKMSTPVGQFTISKNPPSVEVVVPEMVPEQFLRVIPESKEPDKQLILSAMKEGADVPGCKFVNDKTHITLK